MASLRLHDKYSRQEVHGIFSPDTNFTPQSGTWGIQGVVPIADRPGDFVFFVTFGKTQGSHTFDEGITEDGVLSWQSQPQQTLNDPRVLRWTHHNELVNHIYLFLRTNNTLKYSYLGQLKYLDHDKERERPVYFQWQILDWSISADELKNLGLSLQVGKLNVPESGKSTPLSGLTLNELIEVEPPASSGAFGQPTSKFRTTKIADRSVKDANDRKLGSAGELAVIAKEIQFLKNIGRSDLAQKVFYVSAVEGDGAGYDIKSFSHDGQIRYIEVKTTRGGISTPFFMSINEIRFSELHAENYVLYRLFEFSIEEASGKLFKVEGNIQAAMQLEPINFRVRK
jgi:hypothetical protein